MEAVDWTMKLFEDLKQLDFVKDIQIIHPPGDVDADLAILLITTHWKGGYVKKISMIITNIASTVLEETGHSIGIYWDWKVAA